MLLTPNQTAIPVQQGDILGIYCDGSFCMSNAGTGSDVIYATGLDQPPGSTQTFTGVSPERIPVSATLQPAPGINLISPTSGSIKGGTSVTIAGHDFQGTSVSFGGVPAMSLTVNSDSQITAVSPPASKPGPTDIRVTTVAGTSPVVVADRFTYTACVVPKLKGKKLKADKKKLSKADCKLGKVKGPKGKNAKVKKQKPKPGTILAPGSKVKVTTK